MRNILLYFALKMFRFVALITIGIIIFSRKCLENEGAHYTPLNTVLALTVTGQ